MVTGGTQDRAKRTRAAIATPTFVADSPVFVARIQIRARFEHAMDGFW